MIELTLLNGQPLVVNADQIERIEARPDTILSMTSGRKILVRESVRETIKRLIEYRREMQFQQLPAEESLMQNHAIPGMA